MKKGNRTSYALLMRSEEKGRGLAETGVYALLLLSAIISILQFAQQSRSLPMAETMFESSVVRHVLHQPVMVPRKS